MKTSLAHLPEDKRDELKLLQQIILEEVDAGMIILFGSYARGNWVDDSYTEGHITYEYKSDFDILIITDPNMSSKRYPVWDNLQKRINGLRNSTRASIIRHSISFVNAKIQRGNYFFTDILKEGVLLYDSGKYRLEKPKELDPKLRHEVSKEDFEHWFNSASGFLIDFGNALDRGDFRKGAFYLHQASEQFYTTILLVFTRYKPKLHDLEELGQQVGGLYKDFFTVFPQSTHEEKRLFGLLKSAYIDARYKKDFSISKEELEYLSERVKFLKDLTEKVCKEKLKELAKK